MDIETQLRLLSCLFLVVLITYIITRNYYRNIIKMQDRYIESLRNDYQKLEKENNNMEKDITETLNHMNASIDILGTEINKIHKHNNMKEIKHD